MDKRTKQEKLEAMAKQTSSPIEAEIARKKLSELKPPQFTNIASASNLAKEAKIRGLENRIKKAMLDLKALQDAVDKTERSIQILTAALQKEKQGSKYTYQTSLYKSFIINGITMPYRVGNESQVAKMIYFDGNRIEYVWTDLYGKLHTFKPVVNISNITRLDGDVPLNLQEFAKNNLIRY